MTIFCWGLQKQLSSCYTECQSTYKHTSTYGVLHSGFGPFTTVMATIKRFLRSTSTYSVRKLDTRYILQILIQYEVSYTKVTQVLLLTIHSSLVLSNLTYIHIFIQLINTTINIYNDITDNDKYMPSPSSDDSYPFSLGT